jgi:signal transduction histidine kinase
VSLRRDGDHGVIAVRDNGPGIPPAARRRLFDAFFTTKGQRGTGLGLYLSRQFVERQGGSLELLATDAAGTTFELRLPLAPAPRAGRRGRAGGARRPRRQRQRVDTATTTARADHR